MARLAGRVAIITGAGEGIGRGIARRFAAEGASVVVAELRPKTGKTTADELHKEFGVRAEFLPVDVGDKSQVEGMVQQTVDALGRVDILVNNAWGGGSVGRLEQKTDEQMEHGFRIGYYAAHWAMQATLPHMRSQGSGRIINLCSLNGVNAHLYTAEYNVSKEALRALTRLAAREWGEYGITANVICPAAATAAYEAFRQSSPQNAAEVLSLNPMRRMGDPERDIGGVALFLASDDAAYVTGNTIFADGGSHIGGVPWAPELPDAD
jgi:NAD(P)-dependent dehydrogenase (short-subunit alcohol dehydrogenase family)